MDGKVEADELAPGDKSLRRIAEISNQIEGIGATNPYHDPRAAPRRCGPKKTPATMQSEA